MAHELLRSPPLLHQSMLHHWELRSQCEASALRSPGGVFEGRCAHPAAPGWVGLSGRSGAASAIIAIQVQTRRVGLTGLRCLVQGWYCTRAALWAVNYEPPVAVQAHAGAVTGNVHVRSMRLCREQAVEMARHVPYPWL